MDIREKEKDKVKTQDMLQRKFVYLQVELYRFVQPGDLLLARVLGYGDSSTAYLLSIAEKELGVISARGQTGVRMVPDTSESVKDVNSDYREQRKVAQVPNMNS